MLVNFSSILAFTLTPPYCLRYSRSGNATKDRIFLLSIEEVVKYFGDSGQFKNRPKDAYFIEDQYNSARIAEDADGIVFWWWRRPPRFVAESVIFNL